MTLASRTITGLVWNFSEQVVRRGISVLVTLLLAHFLAPEAFGLVAVMSSIIAIASGLMESGFKQALIRMEHADQLDYNTAFYSNLFLGITAYIIVYNLAPLIADYYEEPRITALVQTGGIIIIINAFNVVQSAILSRKLNFKALLMASIPASLISGIVAVMLAYLGFGVWALVGHMIIYALLSIIFIWHLNDWRPSLAVSSRSFHEMFSFGSRLFAAATIDTIFRNLYIFVIAKYFYATIAGYYFFADKIKDLVVSQLVRSIKNVTYPALSTLQNDNAKLKDGYRKVLRLSTFTLFPAMTILAALAEPLFNLFLPEIWEPAIIYLQILCIAAILMPVHSLNLNILQVKGRSDLYLRLEIIKKATLVVILVISLEFGILGVLIGRVINSIIGLVPNSYYSSRLINYSAKEQLADFMPALFLSGLVGILTYTAVTVLHWPAYIEISIFGLLSIMLYLLTAYTLKMKGMELAIHLYRNQFQRNI